MCVCVRVCSALFALALGSLHRSGPLYTQTPRPTTSTTSTTPPLAYTIEHSTDALKPRMLRVDGYSSWFRSYVHQGNIYRTSSCFLCVCASNREIYAFTCLPCALISQRLSVRCVNFCADTDNRRMRSRFAVPTHWHK